jgi:nitroreductase
MLQVRGYRSRRMDKRIGVLEALATTRAIRRYRDVPIPEADLATILWHAARAPSGSNRQPFRFIVLRDEPATAEPRALLGRAFRESWARKRLDAGFDARGGTVTGTPKARAAAAMQHFVDHLEQTPVIVLVGLERYREASPYEGASVYPACQNLLLAARGLGYGGALTMWHLPVEAELRRVLDIPESVALSGCMTLGVPAGRHGPLRRRPLGEIVHDGRWGRPAAWLEDGGSG